MSKRINNIFLDYENGIVQINGQVPLEAVNVTIKEPDGWDIRKLLNPENRIKGVLSLEIEIKHQKDRNEGGKDQ
jgi:hypothetical protein